MANELISLKMGSINQLESASSEPGQLLFARDVLANVYDREYIYLDRPEYSVDPEDPEKLILSNTTRVRLSAEHAITADGLFTPIKIDGYSVNGRYDISHYGTCSTSASAETKTVTLINDEHVDIDLSTGFIMFVNMTHENTHEDPLLQIGVGGNSYSIRRSNGLAPGGAIGVSWEANSIVEFVFVRESAQVAYWMMANQNKNTLPVVYCNTASSIQNKVGICNNYSLANGQYIYLILENDNTYTSNNITLNVNGCGAIPVKVNNSLSNDNRIPAGIYLIYYEEYEEEVNGVDVTRQYYYLNTDGILPGAINKAVHDYLGNDIADTYVKTNSFYMGGANDEHSLYYNNGYNISGNAYYLTLPFVLQAGDTMTGKLTINDNNSSALTDLFEIKRNTTNYFKVTSSKISSDSDLEIGKTGSAHNIKLISGAGYLQLFVSNTAGTEDKGIDFYNSSNVKTASAVYDNTNNRFKFSSINSSYTETFVLPSASGTAAAAGTYNILTTKDTLTVPQGGTGMTSLVNNGVLYGSGVGAINSTSAPDSGSILIGSVNEEPSWLAIGAEGKVLTVAKDNQNNLYLSWETPSVSVASISALSSLNANRIYYPDTVSSLTSSNNYINTNSILVNFADRSYKPVGEANFAVCGSSRFFGSLRVGKNENESSLADAAFHIGYLASVIEATSTTSSYTSYFTFSNSSYSSSVPTSGLYNNLDSSVTSYSWSYSSGRWQPGNAGYDKSYASMKWTALSQRDVSIEYNIISEANCDKFYVFLNGTQKLVASGTVQSRITFNVKANDEISILYVKDQSLTTTDRCWINIKYSANVNENDPYTVNINTDIIPLHSGEHSLGSSGKRWNSIYTNILYADQALVLPTQASNITGALWIG